MADVLSQSEVESLLASLAPNSAMRPRTQSHSDHPPSAASSVSLDRHAPAETNLMRSLRALHETFGREWGTELSRLMRTTVDVRLISFDQFSYGEFALSVEEPTCFNVLRADQLGGPIVINLNRAIVFPMIDRLLGGGCAPPPAVPRRPLTEIELSLASRITDSAIESLRRAWAGICDLALSVRLVESNPRNAPIISTDEVVVVVTFEISTGEVRGVANLCLPSCTLAPVANKLGGRLPSAEARSASGRPQSANLEGGALPAGAQMVVYLASTRLTATELAGLAVGDVIVTENRRNRPLEVCIDGQPKFEGFAGLARGHKAVRIGKPVVPIAQPEAG
jgi:flagellar motor switch protein FliM